MRKFSGLAVAIVLSTSLGCSSSSSSSGGSNVACATSSCVKLAAADGAQRVVVDSTAAYFTHRAGVTRVDLADGKVTQLVTGVYANQITLDATTVYYSLDADHVNSQIFSVPKSGGQPTMLAQNQLTPEGMVVADGALFWTTFGTYDATKADGTMMRLDLATKTTTTIASNLFRGFGVYAKDGNVYFASAGSVTPGRDGAVWKVPTSGTGAPVAIASGLNRADHLAADSAGLYVEVTSTSNGSDDTGTEIDQFAQFSGAPQKLFTMPEDIFGLAADDTGMYVAKGIGVVDLRGTGTTLVDTGDPTGLALDADHFYVADFHTGLWRVARK